MKNILIRTEISKQDLATIADVTVRQVNSWFSGAYNIPQPIALLLWGIDQQQISKEWLVNTVEYEINQKIT